MTCKIIGVFLDPTGIQCKKKRGSTRVKRTHFLSSKLINLFFKKCVCKKFKNMLLIRIVTTSFKLFQLHSVGASLVTINRHNHRQL